MINYQAKLSQHNRQSIAYFKLSVAPTTGKHLKKNFLADAVNIKEFAQNNQVSIIATTNPDFFKFATGSKHFMNAIGDCIDGIGEYAGFTIVPVLNYFMLLSQPQRLTELNLSVSTLDSILNGTFKRVANKLDEIEPVLLYDLDEIRKVLDRYSQLPEIAMDIETTGLVLGREKIITIALAESNTKGYAFPTCEEYSDDYLEIRELLKDFFINYKGNQLWYNAIFDVPFILRELLGISLYNRKLVNSTLNGWSITDVMHLKYLCVNGLQRTSLGLKDELLSLYGEYDSNVDQSKLLDYSYEDVGKYNIYDVTGTFEVYNKYSVKIVEEEQLDIYNDYYKPSLITLIKLKYQGLIVDKNKLAKADKQLTELLTKEYEVLNNNQYIQEINYDLRYNAMFKYNSTHVKQKSVDDFAICFNPNSSKHKVMLFIDTWGYDVLETTKTGNPSVGKDTVAKYMEYEKDEEKLEVLNALIEIGNASKVQGTFFKAFKELTVEDERGYHRLHGNFKLHGTVSGRLSSNEPNLQNLPAGSKYGKLVKSLFIPEDGYLFAGADFNALEDRVGAEETRDKAKCKVMLEGYDSHSLNASAYFSEELKERGLPYGTDITAEESFIIKEVAADLRQLSKAVTFGMAYGATEHSVSKSLGITKEEAKVIVSTYHKLYSGVQKYYDKYLKGAINNNGVGITPHGLKIRCPELLSDESYIVEKAERSYCNALIQGLSGQLMVKAINRIQSKIEEQGLENDIIIFLTIHDAIYLQVRKDVEVIKIANELVISEMIKDYKEDQLVDNKAELDFGFDWRQQETLKNNATTEEITEFINNLTKNP
jgi:DNA polymerase-1